MTIYITQYGMSFNNNQQYDFWLDQPVMYIHETGSPDNNFTGKFAGSLVVNYKGKGCIEPCAHCSKCQHITRLPEEVLVFIIDLLPKKKDEVVKIEVSETFNFRNKTKRYIIDKGV